MISTFHVPRSLLPFMLVTLGWWGNGTHSAVAAQPLELKLEQVSNDPYPLQAVRIRATLSNPGEKPYGPVNLTAESLYTTVEQQKPAAGTKRTALHIRDRWKPRTQPSALADLNEFMPIHLAPGEKVSVSFSVSMSTELRRVSDPLFPEPGVYELRCQHYLLSNVASIQIKVLEPKGENNEVFELLRKERDLTTLLLSPTSLPNAEQVAAVKDLIKKYWHSPWAPYFRFALARAYLDGVGVGDATLRVRRAMAADVLDKLTEGRFGPAPRDEFRKRFAFMPEALVRKLEVPPPDSTAAVILMNRDFRDASSWLECIAKAVPGLTVEGTKFLEEVFKDKFGEDNDAKFRPIADNWRKYRKGEPVLPETKEK